MSKVSRSAGLIAIFLALMFLSVASISPDAGALLNIKTQWKADLPNWISGSDPCTTNWTGITCNDQGRVTVLNLTNQGLKGPIPQEISSLEFLTILDLGNSNYSSAGPWNQITGNLSAVGALTKLHSLNLTFNILGVDEFPNAVLQLTNLIELRLDNTLMEVQFPTDLTKLTKLQYLYLGNNSFTGELPIGLGNLVDLVEFSLWNCSLQSSIPSDLGFLANLKYLNFHGNSLWGGLPPEFGNLSSIKTLYLYGNKLSGTIPETWQNMKSLQDLRLYNNYLTKAFPLWILNQSSLQNVDISINQLYGDFPILNGTNLTYLNVACNYFSGSKPVSNISHTELSASGNCFTGNNLKQNCQQFYTCSEFNKQLVKGCPPCQQFQILQDTTSCVCSLEADVQTGQETKAKSSETGVIIGSISGAIVFALLIIIAFYFWRKSKKSDLSRFGRSFSVKEHQGYWEAPKGVKRFTLQELARATNSFDDTYEIGVGGFGKVFYGILDNDKKVAIKRASTSSMQGSVEFRNEVVLLSRLHHRNLVRLEGFCEDVGLQILVYEYMPNGNLHTWLFQNNKEKTLHWYKRIEIAVGIAQGLDYLHSFADPPVIHRDVKPSNILLDENLVAKLADFGISKATLEFETHVSTTPAGTAGYIDPQYFLRRQLTTASDVYGFGVVLLELVTGQKAIDYMRLDEQNLVEWAGLKLKLEGIRGIVDPRFNDDYPKILYHDLAKLAIDCASFNKNDRPSIKEVVAILESHISAVRPPNEIIYEPPESSQDHFQKKNSDSTERSETWNEDNSSPSTQATDSATFKKSIVLLR